MISQPDDLRDPLLELDTEAALMVGAEGEAVVGEAESESNCGVPAMGACHDRVDNVGEWRLHFYATERCQHHPVLREVDTIAVIHAERREQGKPAFIELVGEEAVIRHILTLS